MNILTDNLPTTVAGYKIRTDYKSWILYEELIRDDTVPWRDKLLGVLSLTVEHPEEITPEDMETVLRGLIAFHAGKNPDEAEEPSPTSHAQEKGTPEAYDYDIDQALILAAFRQTYGIDLSTASMHWHVFRALLEGLPDDTRFMKIVGYRTADTSKMPKQTAQQYNALKARYAIRRERKPMTREEAEQQMKDKVAALFAAAERKKREHEQGKG